MKVKYSLILPAYNESKALPELFSEAIEMLTREPELEVILVDNGSTDNSLAVINSLSIRMKKYNFRQFTKDINTGYGEGIWFGVEKAKGDFIIWSHADGQCSLHDVIKCIQLFRSNGESKEVIIKGMRQERKLIDKIFSLILECLNRLINNVKIEEINAQPNLIAKEKLIKMKDVPTDSTFELAVLTKAAKMKMTIKYFPVKFHIRQHGVGNNDGLFKKFKFSYSCLRTMLDLKSTNVNH